MDTAGLSLLVQGAIGYLWQWARGPKHVPNWVSWLVFGLACVAGYWWATPDAVESFRTDWRAALYALVSFVLVARGVASTAADAKIAPKTNSQ